MAMQELMESRIESSVDRVVAAQDIKMQQLTEENRELQEALKDATSRYPLRIALVNSLAEVDAAAKAWCLVLVTLSFAVAPSFVFVFWALHMLFPHFSSPPSKY